MIKTEFCNMADVHNKETRSYNMSQIKGKDTKPELIVRKFLFANGFRYRIHDNNLPGKPDIVMRKHKTVIFIQGCFWHGHSKCMYFQLPKTRTDWWKSKIENTINRDSKNIFILKKEGWKVICIFECSLKSAKRTKTLTRLVRELNKNT